MIGVWCIYLEAPERCGVSVALAALPEIEFDGSREFVTVAVFGGFARGGVVVTTGGVEGVVCYVEGKET